MPTSKSDKNAMTPAPDGTETEHTVVDGKVEHTVRVAYAPVEKTPPPEPIEHTAPGVPPPPPTTSGSTKWQPQRDTGVQRRTEPAISVGRPPATRAPAPRPVAAAPTTGVRAAAMPPQGTPAPHPQATPPPTAPVPQPPRQALPVPPPFESFEDERPQALTFTNMFEKDAQTAVAKLQYWLKVAVTWLAPRARAGAHLVAAFTVSTWHKATAAVQAARAPADGKNTLDLEAESTNVADPTRAKKWDQFRQGKQSSGYLIKDDK